MGNSQSLNFFKYLFGLQPALTSDTPDELALLERLASKSRLVVEVGVFQGVASSRMAAALPPGGRLILVDPFFRDVKLERWFRFSMNEFIARRTTSAVKDRVTFIRETSARASRLMRDFGCADLIFIDARHDYNSVLEDLNSWTPVLKESGLIAFHDSRMCPACPGLDMGWGSVQVVHELEQGLHGSWETVEVADGITVVKRGRRRPPNQCC